MEMLDLYLTCCYAFSVAIFLDAMFTKWQQKRYKRIVPMNEWNVKDYPDMVLTPNGAGYLWMLFSWPLLATVLIGYITCSIFTAFVAAFEAFFDSLKDSFNDLVRY